MVDRSTVAFRLSELSFLLKEAVVGEKHSSVKLALGKEVSERPAQPLLPRG